MPTYADPNGNGASTAWTGTWTNVDDAVREPVAGDGAALTSSTDEQMEDLTFTDPSFVAGVAYTVKLRGSGGSKRAVDLQYSLDNGSTWKPRVANVIPAAATLGWYSYELPTPPVSQTELTNFRLRLICNATAGGGGASAVSVDVVYLEIADSVVAVTGTALVSGGGGVTVVGVAAETVAASGVAAVSGGGAVAVVGMKGASRAAAVTGGGAVVALGVKSASGAPSVAGGGAVTAVGTASVVVARSGTAAVAGGGVIVAVGVKAAAGVAVIVGGGTVGAVAAKRAAGTAGVAGGGAVVAVGAAVVALDASGVVSVVGGGAVLTSGWRSARTAVAVTGGGAVVVVGVKAVAGAGSPERVAAAVASVDVREATVSVQTASAATVDVTDLPA